MNAFRWLASPLTATAGVVAGLSLISLPLRQLTSALPAALPKPAPVSDEANIPAVLRLRLLSPADRVVIAQGDGRELLHLDNAPAGESEHDVTLGLDHGGVDIEVRIEDAYDGETAVFLTVMPDGREERTRYAIGAGDFSEVLRFDWPHAH